MANGAVTANGAAWWSRARRSWWTRRRWRWLWFDRRRRFGADGARRRRRSWWSTSRSATEFKELARYKVAATPTMRIPVASGKRIFTKDQDNVVLWTVE